MEQRISLALRCAVVALLAACGQRSPEASRAFDSVIMERAPCFGTCPVYRIELRWDGSVLYTGIRSVKEIGERRARIGAEDLDLVGRALRRVEFDQLQDSYSTVKDGCKLLVTDLPGVKIEVRRDGVSKKVNYYFGCRGMPELDKVAWLASTLDEATRSGGWVGDPFLTPPPEGPGN